MNQNAWLFRPAAISFSMRRQPAISKKNRDFSRDFMRLSGRTFLTIFFIFFIVSQFFSWRINQEQETIEQLQIIHESMRIEQDAQRAKRDKLIAKPRMAALAAAQLNLHFPKKGQEHTLY